MEAEFGAEPGEKSWSQRETGVRRRGGVQRKCALQFLQPVQDRDLKTSGHDGDTLFLLFMVTPSTPQWFSDYVLPPIKKIRSMFTSLKSL